jgi:PRTRC genetic system ThiF family protein
MRVEHRLPSDLVSRRPLKVLVVGAGGTGSAVVMGLPYLDQAMRVWGSAGLDVALMDADIVSETNCVRQPFSRSDIGQSKANVLINRLNLFWGTRWSSIPQLFHARSFERSQDRTPDLLIGCVDSRAARKAIEQALTRSASSTCYWLDLGNNAASGQYPIPGFGHIASICKWRLRGHQEDQTHQARMTLPEDWFESARSARHLLQLWNT